MRKLGSRKAGQPSGRLRQFLPSWWDVIVFASVVPPMAVTVVFFALYLVRPSHSGQLADLSGTARERCLEQPSTP